jgi:hypothetical protein
VREVAVRDVLEVLQRLAKWRHDRPAQDEPPKRCGSDTYE